MMLKRDPRPGPERIALIQATYFAASGLWPLVHMRSFERVLGEKREDWLVRTVALLVLAIAGTLGLAVAKRDMDPHVKTLGVLGATAPAIASAVGVITGRMSRLYAVDAVIELALIAAWCRSTIRDRSGSSTPSGRSDREPAALRPTVGRQTPAGASTLQYN